MHRREYWLATASLRLISFTRCSAARSCASTQFPTNCQWIATARCFSGGVAHHAIAINRAYKFSWLLDLGVTTFPNSLRQRFQNIRITRRSRRSSTGIVPLFHTPLCLGAIGVHYLQPVPPVHRSGTLHELEVHVQTRTWMHGQLQSSFRIPEATECSKRCACIRRYGHPQTRIYLAFVNCNASRMPPCPSEGYVLCPQ